MQQVGRTRKCLSRATAVSVQCHTHHRTVPSDEPGLWSLRLPLVEATRAWRQGVRTVVLLNDTLPSELAKRRDYRQHAANEVYLTYQDVDNSAVWWLKKGDLRCAFGHKYPGEPAEVIGQRVE